MLARGGTYLVPGNTAFSGSISFFRVAGLVSNSQCVLWIPRLADEPCSCRAWYIGEPLLFCTLSSYKDRCSMPCSTSFGGVGSHDIGRRTFVKSALPEALL